MGFSVGGAVKSATKAGNLGSGFNNVRSGNWSFGGLGGKPGALGDNDVIGKEFDKINPWVQRAEKSKKAAEEAGAAADAYGVATGGLNRVLDSADTKYYDNYKKNSDSYLRGAQSLVADYTNKTNALKNQAESQAKDARTVYSNDILPAYKDSMAMAQKNAAQAMTLSEAGDPNNKIMKAVRELYDQQGQTARQQGQQDFGVLSALGAQAAGQQFGAGNPMTAGQQGQIYAANQAQAGDAYARAQQRMHDLQQQGLDRGFDQSNLMYQMGQDAQSRYGDTIKSLQGGQLANSQEQGMYRDELGGYNSDIFGTKSGYNADKFNMGMTGAGIQKGNAYAGTGREQNIINQRYGVQQQGINNELAAALANAGATTQLISTLGSAAIAASDKREKKKIGSVSDQEIDEFLKAVKPKTFEYKEPEKAGRAPGERIGFMLQDVQGTKLGDKMTTRGPEGELMYDKDNLNGIILAALSRQAKGRAA